MNVGVHRVIVCDNANERRRQRYHYRVVKLA